jgi:hypothetical protein
MMKRTSWGVFLLGLILVLAACTMAEVNDAIMITGFDAKGEPLPEVLSYKPDAPKFICLAAVLRAPPETKITFVWIYKTGNIEIDKAVIPVSGSKAVNSTLTRGEKPWPVGDYVVHVYIDDQKNYANAAPFVVKE